MKFLRLLRTVVVFCVIFCIVTASADDKSVRSLLSNSRWIPVVKDGFLALQVVNSGSGAFEVSPDARISTSNGAVEKASNHLLDIKPFARKNIIYVSLTFVGSSLNADTELPSNGGIRPVIKIEPGEGKTIELSYRSFLGEAARGIVDKCTSIKLSFEMNDVVFEKLELVQNKKGSWELKQR